MTEGGIKKMIEMIEEILRKKYGYRGEIRVSSIEFGDLSSKAVVYECNGNTAISIYESRDLNNIATKLIVDSVLDFVLKNYGDIIRRIIEKKLEIIYEDNEVFKKILSDPKIEIRILLSDIEVCKNSLYIKWDLYTTYIELSNEARKIEFSMNPRDVGIEGSIIQGTDILICRENYTGSYEDVIKLLKNIDKAIKVAQLQKI